MTASRDIATIKRALQADIERLVETLIPGALDKRWRSRGLTQPPYPEGRAPGTFTIWLAGDAAGAFKDFANEKDRGDVFGLIGFVRRCSLPQALDYAEDFLGWRDMPADLRKAKAREAKDAAARRAKREETERAEKRARAWQLWSSALALTPDCEAVRYLAGRGLDLARLDIENSFRFRPSLPYWGPGDTDRERRFPVLVSKMVDAGGACTAVHLTYLQGAKKAPVPRAKIVLGEVIGSVVRLTRGGGPPFGEGGAPTPLGLTEGIENGLTAALVEPGARWWAAYSLSNLRHVPVDDPRVAGAVSEILIFADNDQRLAQAQEFEGCVDMLRARAASVGGRPIQVLRAPPPHKDANAWWQAVHRTEDHTHDEEAYEDVFDRAVHGG